MGEARGHPTAGAIMMSGPASGLSHRSGAGRAARVVGGHAQCVIVSERRALWTSHTKSAVDCFLRGATA